MRASLNQLKEAVKAVGSSPNIEGPAAENIKRYVTSVYGSSISALETAVEHHCNEFIEYAYAYENNKLGGETIVYTDELEELSTKLNNTTPSFNTVNSNESKAKKSLLGIVTLPTGDIDNVHSPKNDIRQNIIKKTLSSIEDVESSHQTTETRELIDHARTYIGSVSAQRKTVHVIDFDDEHYANVSDAAMMMGASATAVQREEEKNKDKYDEAKQKLLDDDTITDSKEDSVLPVIGLAGEDGDLDETAAAEPVVTEDGTRLREDETEDKKTRQRR